MDESISSASDKKYDENGADNTFTFTEKEGSHCIHACEIEVTFPTNLQAEQALQILQVDKEPTARVSKSFHLTKTGKEGSTRTNGDKCSSDSVLIYKMKVRFESKELKMLRVSVSSFYDYLTVVLKTFQEFETTNVV